jgi:hypothetical protein
MIQKQTVEFFLNIFCYDPLFQKGQGIHEKEKKRVPSASFL